MSVILDSLRRARGAPSAARPEPSAQPAPKPVPEHLRAGPAPVAATPPRLRPQVLIGVVAAGIVIWAAVQLSLGVRAPGPVTPNTPDFTAAGRIPPPAPAASGPSSSFPGGQDAEPTVDAAPAASARAKPGSEPKPQPVRDPDAPRAAPVQQAVAPQPQLPAPATRPTPPVASAPTAGAPPTPGSFDLAVKYHASGNFEQAIVQYLAVLEREPFNLQARNNLGMLYRDRGARDEAIRQLQLAVKGDPRYLTARRNLAVVYLEAGRVVEARVELNAALRVDPRNVDTLVNLALVDRTSGRSEVAKETLLKALALDGKHALAHYNLALIYEEESEVARAHHHYSRFLDYAEPGYATELVNVQAKVDALGAKLFPAGER